MDPGLPRSWASNGDGRLVEKVRKSNVRRGLKRVAFVQTNQSEVRMCKL